MGETLAEDVYENIKNMLSRACGNFYFRLLFGRIIVLFNLPNQSEVGPGLV